MLTNRQQSVIQIIQTHTLSSIRENNIENLGLCAEEISYQLHCDRSNISRDCNKLCQDGLLIKQLGRPTRFAYKPALLSFLRLDSLPSTVSNFKDLYEKLPSTNIASFDTSHTLRLASLQPIIKTIRQVISYPIAQHFHLIAPIGTELESILSLLSKETSLPFIRIDCSQSDDIKSLLFGSTKEKNNKKGVLFKSANSFVILEHIDTLPKELFSSLTMALASGLFKNNDGLPSQPLNTKLIVTTSTSLPTLPLLHKTICIPTYNKRSLTDKLILVMQAIQNEADRIKTTIYLPKDVLSCFAMSSYQHNQLSLQLQIRDTCIRSFQRMMEYQDLSLSLSLNDLSDELLLNISNVDHHYYELKRLLSLLNESELYFSPFSHNRELEHFYSNLQVFSDNAIQFNVPNSDLVTTCIKDINEFSKIHLNSLRSVLIQDIYDLVYPILKNHSIINNENLLYGLLNKIMHSSADDKYTLLQGSDKIARDEDRDCAESICIAIKKNNNKLFSLQFKQYIAIYLYLSSRMIEEKRIQILIDVSFSKPDFLDSIQYHLYPNVHLIDTHPIHIEQYDHGKGCFLFTNSQDIISSRLCHVMPLNSLELLLETIQYTQIIGAKINEFHLGNSDKNSISQTEMNQLLSQMTSGILDDSLVFLNSRKTIPLLTEILKRILITMDLQMDESILIKFIFHCSFMLERCIKKETLHFTSSKVFIRQNTTLINCVEKEFQLLSESFGCSIPLDEICYISDIFINFLDSHKQ